MRRAGAMRLRPFCHGAGHGGRRQPSGMGRARALLHQPLMLGGIAAGPVGGHWRTGVIILPPWGRSSAGRARRSQCRGREFDPPRLHHPIPKGRLHAGPFSFRGWRGATRPVCWSGNQQQPCCRSRSQSLGSFCPWHHVFQGRHRNGPADQTLQRCHLRRAA